jgi:ASC-1-like (ASCH) protein
MANIIEEAQSLLDEYDPYYHMVSEGEYDYLLPNCKSGQEFINKIRELYTEMKTQFLVNAILAVREVSIKANFVK